MGHQALRIYLQHALGSAKAVLHALKMREQEEIDKSAWSRAIALAEKSILTCQNCIYQEDGRWLSQHGVYSLIALSRMEDSLKSQIESNRGRHEDRGVRAVSLCYERAAKFQINSLISYRLGLLSLSELWQFAATLCDIVCSPSQTVKTKEHTKSYDKVQDLYRDRTKYDHLQGPSSYDGDKSAETALQAMRYQREAWACGTIAHLLRTHRSSFPWNAEKLEAAYNRKRRLAITLAEHSASLTALIRSAQSSADPLERQVREATVRPGQRLVGLYRESYETCTMTDGEEVEEAQDAIEALRNAADSVARVIAVLDAFAQDPRPKPAEAVGAATRIRQDLEEDVADLLSWTRNDLVADLDELHDTARNVEHLLSSADQLRTVWPCSVAYRRNAEEASKGLMDQHSPAQRVIATGWEKACQRTERVLDALPAYSDEQREGLAEWVHNCCLASNIATDTAHNALALERRVADDTGRLPPRAKLWLLVASTAMTEIAEVMMPDDVDFADLLRDSFFKKMSGITHCMWMVQLVPAALRCAAAVEAAGNTEARDSVMDCESPIS